MDSKVSFQKKEIMEEFQVKTFQPQYAKAFYELNKNWIEEYWELEQSDLNDLLNPIKSVIEKGCEIFFILHKEVIIGTAAMIPLDNRIMELAKMTNLFPSKISRYRGNIKSELKRSLIQLSKSEPLSTKKE